MSNVTVTVTSSQPAVLTGPGNLRPPELFAVHLTEKDEKFQEDHVAVKDFAEKLQNFIKEKPAKTSTSFSNGEDTGEEYSLITVLSVYCRVHVY